MSKFHTTITQWGLVSGIRQARSDLIVVNEARSPFSPEARKGQLILVVEAEGDVARGREACSLVASTICDVFYEDGSTSITSSLRHAIKAANAALYRHNFDAPPHKRALVGVSCAAIHGGDVYLAQVPPSQAFVSHTARLRAIPIPPSWTNGADTSAVNRHGALGTSLGSEPEFSRSVLQPGDTIVLCSTNLVQLIGRQLAEELIGYADAETIAEELFARCRSASMPEAHAVVIEAVPGPAPDDRDASFTPVAVADRSRQLVSRWNGLFNRPSQPARADEPASATEDASVAVATADVPENPPVPVVAGANPEAKHRSLVDLLPVADDLPLPPSAFVGESEYGGLVRPPAVPRRNRQVDLSDNHGIPIDFAAIPRKAPPPPPTLVDRLTLPIRLGMGGLMNGVANVPRRTKRPAEQQPAAGLRLKGLSYRRQRPPLPWLNIVLLVGVVALLIAVGMHQNRRRDFDTVSAALAGAESSVQAARSAPDPDSAQIHLAEAEAALNGEIAELVETGLIRTDKREVWSRYIGVRGAYDRAMASINRIGFVDEIETVATLPGDQGLISRLVLGTTATISDTEPPIFFLDREAGVLYSGPEAQPILNPGEEAGAYVATNIREALWREEGNNVIAFDRGDPLFPVYHVYLRNGDSWLANQLNQTEHMEPADRNLPMADFGGHLYLWDQKEKQLWKYASGMYADLPTPWITNAGDASLEQVVDVQIDGTVYLLNRDGSVLVFEAGEFKRQIPRPELKVPLGNITRFVVTPDEYEEDGITIKRPGFIYLLDLRHERVLQINKVDGTLIQQIQARTRGPLNQISDLAVDESRRMLYLANGSRVLRTALPEPAEIMPVEAAAPSPSAAAE